MIYHLNGVPVAIIDFDSASPGRRVEDLSYAAWLWLDIGNEEYSANEQARRIRIIFDSYSMETKSALCEMQNTQRTRICEAEKSGIRKEFVAWATNCLLWLKRNEEQLQKALSAELIS